MKIELTPTAELRPYLNNARTHSRKQIRQIARSIETFGFCNPVLTDDANQIIAGQGRLEAAKLLGIEAVPTCRLSHLSEAEKRAYILADNRLAEKAGWDRELLAIELQGLIELEFDIELTGFDTAEVDIILEEARDTQGGSSRAEDQVPDRRPEVAVSQPGDLWVLGNHRLLCADPRDQAAFDRLLAGAKAEFAFTDPAHSIGMDHHGCGPGRIHPREPATGSDRMTEAENIRLLQTVCGRLAENTADGCLHQICMDWPHMWEMLAAGRAVYTELRNLCVWNRPNAGKGSFYRPKHGLVFVWKSGNAMYPHNIERGRNGRERTNVWDYAGINTTLAGRLDHPHPTIPVALVADAIKDCSRRAGLVLDPFCGSGTILIAAERTGRKARGLEIDPAHVDIAVRRWQAYTGKSAVLAGSSETFETAEEQRAADVPM